MIVVATDGEEIARDRAGRARGVGTLVPVSSGPGPTGKGVRPIACSQVGGGDRGGSCGTPDT